MEALTNGPTSKEGGGGGGGGRVKGQQGRETREQYFKMPLHYPKYSKTDYETMPEWKLDYLLSEYGIPVAGDVEQKRKFAMGAFLWSH